MTTAPDALEAMVRRLADESEVAKVILRYARGIDRRDFDLVRSCFAPDAFVKGSSFSGPVSEYLPELPELPERRPRGGALERRRAREVEPLTPAERQLRRRNRRLFRLHIIGNQQALLMEVSRRSQTAHGANISTPHRK